MHHDEKPRVLSAATMIGDKVQNLAGEDLGKIEEFMIDLDSGRIAYAVLSFGGFLGMGEKFFAIPWESLVLKADKKTFILNVDKERLKTAPGFDKNQWPDMANRDYGRSIYSYYGVNPYW